MTHSQTGQFKRRIAKLQRFERELAFQIAEITQECDDITQSSPQVTKLCARLALETALEMDRCRRAIAAVRISLQKGTCPALLRKANKIEFFYDLTLPQGEDERRASYTLKVSSQSLRSQAIEELNTLHWPKPSITEGFIDAIVPLHWLDESSVSQPGFQTIGKVVRPQATSQPESTIYAGRRMWRQGLSQSIWHNPFPVHAPDQLGVSLQKFENYLLGNGKLLAHVQELSGKNLACYCAEKGESLSIGTHDTIKCHCQILLKLAHGDLNEKLKDRLARQYEPARELERVG